MALDLEQLCRLLQIPLPAVDAAWAGRCFGGVSTLELAGETDICFAEQPAQLDAVRSSRAGAVVVPEGFPPVEERLLLRSPEPRRGFFRLASAFVPQSEVRGIDSRAVIDASARIGRDVAVGACSVIGAGASVGERSVIGPGCYLGPGVVVGADCIIEAHVSIHRDTRLGDRCILHSGAVIGADGFGFDWDGTAHRKIPQLGRVVIEDDVEIGCNSCVDRATLGETRIRFGTKIDNLVQVAHNTDIGPLAILVSQSGVAGSSRVGAGAVIAGQVAVSDHVRVGAGARVGGQSGVTKDVPAGAAVFGTPARAIKDTLRELAALAQLPALLRQVRQQERELQALRQRLDALEGGGD